MVEAVVLFFMLLFYSNALPKMIDKYMKYTAFYTQLYIMLKSEVRWYGFFLLYSDGGMYSEPVPNAL